MHWHLEWVTLYLPCADKGNEGLTLGEANKWGLCVWSNRSFLEIGCRSHMWLTKNTKINIAPENSFKEFLGPDSIKKFLHVTHKKYKVKHCSRKFIKQARTRNGEQEQPTQRGSSLTLPSHAWQSSFSHGFSNCVYLLIKGGFLWTHTCIYFMFVSSPSAPKPESGYSAANDCNLVVCCACELRPPPNLLYLLDT